MNFPRPRFVPSSSYTWYETTDVVIVGSGAAGLSAALAASRNGRRVTLICKGNLAGGATPLAQGGLAAVMGPDDSSERHISDTLVAGPVFAIKSRCASWSWRRPAPYECSVNSAPILTEAPWDSRAVTRGVGLFTRAGTR